jgi:hypothetical protein
MSFFLAEVSALKLLQDKKMIINIVKLISSGATEEEKDAFGGTPHEDFSAKEIDLIFSYSLHVFHSYASSINNQQCILNLGMPLSGSYEIYSPPPEA